MTFFFQEDSAQVHCVCNTIQLSEKCDFHVSPFSAQVIWGGIVKRLLIAYFIGNISAKKYQHPFMCIKVIASQRWDVFWDTLYIHSTIRVEKVASASTVLHSSSLSMTPTFVSAANINDHFVTIFTDNKII